MRIIWLMLAISVVATATAEQHTWTFNQDGKMRSPSGGQWSFKEKGRLDGAFVSLEGTNVLVLTAYDGTLRLIPVTCLCEDDRAYLRRANPIPESEALNITQTVVAKSAEAGQRADVTQLKTQSASKRRLAQLEIEDAMQLENEARRLGSRAETVEIQRDHHARVADSIQNSAVVPPEASLAYVRAKSSEGFKAGAADRLEADLVRLSREAAEKRAHAARLEQEAAVLETKARSMERDANLRKPVSR